MKTLLLLVGVVSVLACQVEARCYIPPVEDVTDVGDVGDVGDGNGGCDCNGNGETTTTEDNGEDNGTTTTTEDNGTTTTTEDNGTTTTTEDAGTTTTTEDAGTTTTTEDAGTTTTTEDAGTTTTTEDDGAANGGDGTTTTEDEMGDFYPYNFGKITDLEVFNKASGKNAFGALFGQSGKAAFKSQASADDGKIKNYGRISNYEKD